MWFRRPWEAEEKTVHRSGITGCERRSCGTTFERMFDTMTLSEAVAGWRATLSEAMRTSDGLDDAGRIDLIRALEELTCAATAAPAAVTVELDRSQRAIQSDRGVPAAQQGRGVAAQVALARRESPHRGQRHLALARIVTAELPHTWTAWREGRITEWKATLIARETACLTRDDRAALDDVVASDGDRLERLGERALTSLCQQEAYLLDPESYVTRRRRAEADRHVSLRPAPDAMTWMTALLPVKDGVGVYAALTRTADTTQAGGDPRTRGQAMADTLVGSVLGAASLAAGTGVALGLVMSDSALFGTSDEPAHIDGHGPIPAELAREIVAGAVLADEAVWLQRLYTSPTSGQLVTMDSQARLFRGSLARFIRLRDRICRTPWCDAPVRHADHAESVDERGPTTGDNGQGLCEACNHAKQAPGWRARPSPSEGDHQIDTTTPTGHTYRSRAPAIAGIREVPIRIEYLLAG